MRALGRLLFVIAIALVIIYYLDFSVEEDIVFNQSSVPLAENLMDETNSLEQEKVTSLNESIAMLMGKNSLQVKEILGEPQRIDPTPYGYDWWIYNEDLYQYVQIGVMNDEVVTIYTNSENINIAPFYIGQSTATIYKNVPINPVVHIDYKDGMYQFELTENDLNINPLIPIDDFYVQLYFDKFAGALSSVRFLNEETLLTIRPYEMLYIGDLIEAAPLDEEQEQIISQAVSKQIFDLTNVLRLRFQLHPLNMNEALSEVALSHSIDMFESKDFSHVSITYGELSDRLQTREIAYEVAGENIAANYIDAPAVVEGWLNSKGHRETLLHDAFYSIGIGVYKKYYTQNFID